MIWISKNRGREALFVKLKINLSPLSLLSLILIGVFGFIIVNKALYTHSHVLAFGQVVTHTHPFDKSERETGKSHRHTQAEMLILDQINNIFCSLTLMMIVALFAPRIISQSCIIRKTTAVYFFSSSGRSPPSTL